MTTLQKEAEEEGQRLRGWGVCAEHPATTSAELEGDDEETWRLGTHQIPLKNARYTHLCSQLSVRREGEP